MPETLTCPNCHTAIIGDTHLMDDDHVKAINYFTTNQSTGFCNRCFLPLASGSVMNSVKWLEQYKASIETDLELIPVITLQAPHKWEYEMVGMVTAQSVTGEGALTQLISGIQEFWGLEMPRIEKKLRNGETQCAERLKYAALAKDANAVIAVDIDYAELSGGQGTLMVCMSGTAIKITNPEILPEATQRSFERLRQNIPQFKQCLYYAAVLSPYVASIYQSVQR
jgi:uncharacterized protein YbjQ (UPF0145 family)